MEILWYALSLLWWVIVIDAVLSWVQRPHQMPRALLLRITDPLYRPFRAILNPQKTGGIDLSPLAVLLLIQGARSLLSHL